MASTRSRDNLVAAIVVLLTVGAGIAILRQASHAVAPLDNSANPAVRVPPVIATVESGSSVERIQPGERQADTILVLVSSPDSVPIATATVVESRIVGRAVTPTGQPLRCDAEGRAELLPVADGAVLRVGAPGHSPAIIMAPTAGNTYRVVLRPGVRLFVDCVGLNGSPQEGVEITVYERSSEGLLLDGGQSGPSIADIHDTKYSATTDAYGRVDFGWLSPGKYLCEVDDGRFAVIQRFDNAGLVLELSSDQQEFSLRAVVAPILAGVIRVVGDEIVSHTWSDSRRWLHFGTDELQLATRRLQYKNDGCLCIAVAPARGLESGEPQELNLRLETASRGVVERMVPLVPMADVAVGEVDLGRLPVTVRHPSVRLVLRDVRTRELNGLRLELVDVESSARRFSLLTGRRQPLPAGSYRVASVAHEVLRYSLREQGPLTIKESRDVEWTLGIPVEVTKLELAGIDDRCPKYCSVATTLSGKPVGGSGYCAPDEILLVYSDPATSAKVQAFGYRPVEIEALGSRGPVIDIRLERLR